MKRDVHVRFLQILAMVVCLLSLQARGAEDVELAKHPEPLLRASVQYPEDAKKQGVQGVVYIGIRVNEKGNVVEAKVERSDSEMLNNAALKAARQWTFTPAIAKKDGKPVSVWLTIPFKFKLQDDGKAKEQKE